MYLEIFRAGNHTDSNGITGEYTSQNLDIIVQNYQTRISENPNSEAPVVIGHPENADEAKGWVKRLFRRGNTLLADISITDEEFQKSLESEKFRNVSIALDSALNFLHLGFLGAAQPAVEGLNPMKYSAVSNFSKLDDSAWLSGNIKADNEILNSLKEQNDTLRKKVDDYENKLREIENNFLIDSTFSKVGLSKIAGEYRKPLLHLLEILQKSVRNSGVENINTPDSEEFINEFAQITKSLIYSQLLTKSENFQLTEQRLIPERNSIHIKALGILRENPELSYEDALLLAY
ncbi:MAG: hypothetical protein KIT33_08730 [Candidatus Kapabacteria bacterium]|nr:hypothetical protein [Ignavibacteriota bacterium]MCW5885040.1 hypothetical protein [Candidatus Kapabacteria bacterium]